MLKMFNPSKSYNIETKSGGTCLVEQGTNSLKLSLKGTESKKDVLTDIFWFFRFNGYSRTCEIQADEIISQLPSMDDIRTIFIGGHSLGGGVASIIIDKLSIQYPDILFDFQFTPIFGGLCAVSKKVAKRINNNGNIRGKWIVAYRDPVPNLSKLLYSPIGKVEYVGKKKRWFFDYDFDLTKTHVKAYYN